VAAWQAAYRGLLPDHVLDHLSIEESEGRWKERIAEPWGHILVVEHGGRIVGYAACGSTQDEDLDRQGVGEIYVMYVHPDTWRRGHGSALIDECLAHLRQDGFREAILWVLEGNAQAIGFYEAGNFRADGASKVKHRADGTEMSLVRYRRHIAQGEAKR
jgi:ribosomal protein S18 acetylase RimI-like enzyme